MGIGWPQVWLAAAKICDIRWVRPVARINNYAASLVAAARINNYAASK
jgi:hypothetical protein